MILLAALLWLRGRTRRPALVLNAVLAIAVIGMVSVMMVESLASNYERGRRGASDVGRSVGLMFGTEAILNSPFIGYGSWAVSKELTELATGVLKSEAAGNTDAYNPKSGSAGVHSELLQSWVEGGVLGAWFFLVLGYQLLKWFPELAFRRPRDLLTPILLLYTLSAAWHLFFSPFALGARLFAALAGASLVLVAFEKRVRT